jgi:SulP family sulfate permease
LNGPFFFGVVYKFKDSIKLIEKKPKVLILRMRNVPVIDATGLHSIGDLLTGCNRDKTKLILSGLQPLVYEEFLKSRLLFKIGKRYVVPQFEDALRLAEELIIEKGST